MVDDLFDIVAGRSDDKASTAPSAAASGATSEASTDAPGEGSGDGSGDAPPDLILRLHVHPGAGRTAVVGRHGDALKVKVGAPPADGRANAAVLALVAETLGINETQVELSSGASSRSKRVRIRGVEADDLRRALQLAVAGGNSSGGSGVRPATH
jgi:uncharacterized protein (TIGR00251 family)